MRFSPSSTLLLSCDLYPLQFPLPYKLVIQDIESTHSLVSHDHQVLYNPFIFVSTFTKLTFHVLYFNPIEPKAFTKLRF
jgi:hypothetical protein